MNMTITTEERMKNQLRILPFYQSTTFSTNNNNNKQWIQTHSNQSNHLSHHFNSFTFNIYLSKLLFNQQFQSISLF